MGMQLTGSLSISGSIVTTGVVNAGSVTATGTQYVSDTTTPTNFDSTAAIYTDGGMRVTKNVYLSSSLYLKGDLTVYGTQSINYITSSQLDISDNIINVNTATPGVRFGGIAVYDSGSTGLTGSFLWDSQNNKWIYSNPSGSGYDGGMAIFGPRNTSGLGSEQGTTSNALMKGQGGDHITSSLITEDGALMSVYSTMYVSSSGKVGIGTSTPDNTYQGLTVYGTDPSLRLKTSGASGWTWIEFVNNSGTNNFSMGVNQTTPFFGIKAGAGMDNPNITMLSSGNVGIGTISPSTPLHINGSSSQMVRITTSGALSSGYYDAFQMLAANQTGGGLSLNIGKAESSYNLAKMVYFHSSDGSTSNRLGFGFYSADGLLNILGNGNVGIGTSSPSSILNVVSTQSLALVRSTTTTNYVELQLENTTNYFQIGVEGGSGNRMGGTIAYNAYLGSYNNYGMTFHTNNLNRMTITSGGTLYVGTTSNPLSNATPQFSMIAGANTDAISIKHTMDGNNTVNIWQTGNTSHSAIAFYKGNTQDLHGTITVTTSGATYNSVSDYRLKENVVPLENGLDRLMQLKPSKFNWITTGEESEGFIAHELQEIFPGAVTGEKDAVYSSTGNIKPQSVDYGRITPLLVKAIQELTARVQELENK